MKKEKNKDYLLGQLDIFAFIEQLSQKQNNQPINGKASIDAALRSVVSDTLKHSSLSRYEVAAGMSEILGVEITKSQLDSWSAESKDLHRFPLVYLPAFCAATKDNALLRHICGLCGGYYIEGEEALVFEIGRIEEQEQELLKKGKQLAERKQAVRNFLETVRRK